MSPLPQPHCPTNFLSGKDIPPSSSTDVHSDNVFFQVFLSLFFLFSIIDMTQLMMIPRPIQVWLKRPMWHILFIKIVHWFAAAFAPVPMLFRHSIAFSCEETALKIVIIQTSQCSVIQSSKNIECLLYPGKSRASPLPWELMWEKDMSSEKGKGHEGVTNLSAKFYHLWLPLFTSHF